ncbi:MAG: hypothetical protein MHPSP_002783, partial [Paramarteilia canceri]
NGSETIYDIDLNTFICEPFKTKIPNFPKDSLDSVINLLNQYKKEFFNSDSVIQTNTLDNKINA